MIPMIIWCWKKNCKLQWWASSWLLFCITQPFPPFNHSKVSVNHLEHSASDQRNQSFLKRQNIEEQENTSFFLSLRKTHKLTFLLCGQFSSVRKSCAVHCLIVNALLKQHSDPENNTLAKKKSKKLFHADIKLAEIVVFFLFHKDFWKVLTHDNYCKLNLKK